MNIPVKESLDLHAWLGALSSLLLFIVAFSGSVALFHQELAVWENPEYRVPYKEDDKGLAFHWEKAKTEANFQFDEFNVTFPSFYYPFFIFSNYNPETEAFTLVLTEPQTGAILEEGHSEMAHTMAHLHTDLHLPRPYGRYLVGFTGILMMILITTGIFTHRKIFKELMTFRRSSWRAMFSSGHKLLGVWLLPFHLVMAFTGAIIGLLGIIGIFMALASFGGSVDKAAEAVLGPKTQAKGTPAEMVPIQQLIDETTQKWEGFNPTFVTFQAYGDQEALVTVSGNVPGQLAMSAGVTYKGATGEAIHTNDWHAEGIPTWLFGTVTPLHYATYGGILLKLVYFVMGMGMCLLIITGTSIWLERRKRSEIRKGLTSDSFVERFHVGGALGLMVACAAMFFANHLLGGGETQHTLEHIVFFGSWLLGLGYAMFRGNSIQTLRDLLLVSGTLLIASAVLNGSLTGDFFWENYDSNLISVALVDISLIVSGITFFGIALKAKPKKAEREKAIVLSETAQES